MIAYNHQWLRALQIQQVTNQWHQKNLLTARQQTLINQHYPVGFYTPNTFIRIGLGFFCCILLGALQSFFWVVIGIASNWDSVFSVMGILNLLLGTGCFLALEFVIRRRHHYASGIDDVLLYSGAGQVIAGFLLFMSDVDEPLTFFCVALPFLAIGAIRYIDRLLTALTYGCTLTIVLLAVNKLPELSLYLLPFTGILFSLACYIVSKKKQDKPKWQVWAVNLQIIEVISLITLYLSGNYLVIQQSADNIYDVSQVPLAWFFWAFTFLMPVGSIYVGLLNKDRILLWMGLGCVALAVFTFRTYFHVLPMPVASTLAGAFLFTIAYLSIRYLKKGNVLFTYSADDTQKPLFMEAETLIVAQTFGHATQTPENDLSFGGGKFGGGGAGGNY